MRSLRDNATETERVRKLQDRSAAHYDRQISFFERILFGNGRRWVCEQYLRAEGFEIDRLERSKWGIVERVSARKPG